MHFARYVDTGEPQWGVLEGDAIRPIGSLTDDPSIEDVADEGFRATVRRALANDALPRVARDEVKLLAPVRKPGQIVCVGLNYHDHAEEQDEEVPERPLLFGKSPNSVTNPGDPIVHPADVDQVDYEVELAIVIGKRARHVDAADAESYVAGYTVCNDVSARDAQFDDGQFFRGKSYETFAPMGPSLVTADAVDPNDLEVEARVNGETLQSSSTREFIFDVGEVVEYISGITELSPGDVISTGTPGGVGIFRDPPELLSPGDDVEVEVEEIGTLYNPVVGPDGK